MLDSLRRPRLKREGPLNLQWQRKDISIEGKNYRVVISEDRLPWRGYKLEGKKEVPLWRIASHKDGFVVQEGLKTTPMEEQRTIIRRMVQSAGLDPDKIARIQQEVYAPMRHEKLIAPVGDKVPYLTYQFSTGCQRACHFCEEAEKYEQMPLEAVVANAKRINTEAARMYGKNNPVHVRFLDTSNWSSVYQKLGLKGSQQAVEAICNGATDATLLTFLDTPITLGVWDRHPEEMEEHLGLADVYIIGTETFHDLIGPYVLDKHETAEKKIELTKRLKDMGKQVWWTAFTGAYGTTVDIHTRNGTQTVSRARDVEVYLAAVQEGTPDAVLVTMYQSNHEGDPRASAQAKLGEGRKLDIDELRAMNFTRPSRNGYKNDAQHHHDTIVNGCQNLGVYVFPHYESTIIDGNNQPLTLGPFPII